MESGKGTNSGVTAIALEAPSSHHVAPNTQNSTALPVVPQAVTTSAIAGSAGTSEKKKRGRPWEYGPDEISRYFSCNYLVSSASGGRPYILEKKHEPKVENLGELVARPTGGNFLPHMITVNAGEDVSVKIVSFCEEGPRAIWIISAVGWISNVTFRQPNCPGGTLTYRGRFEILFLSGSFTPRGSGGSQNGQGGGMSIILAGPDGRVVAGGLGGLLIAASPVQVIVGSFLPSNQNELKRKHKYERKAIRVSAPTPQTANVEHGNFIAQGLNNWMTECQSTTPSSTLQTVNWASMLTMEDSRKSNTGVDTPLQGE